MIGPRHRPTFHLQPARGWTNDPVGPVRWQDRYHLFHQANPDGGFWARPHWGHFVSDDLVRWQERPLALSPSADGPDEDGCFSGCVVATDRQASVFYTGVSGPAGDGQRQVTCVAHSTDPQLDVWHKAATPVTEPPAGFDLVGFRDPFVWRDGARWLQVVGSGIRDVGGALMLFESSDLRDWSFVGPLLVGRDQHTLGAWTGTMWECPVVTNVGGHDLLLLSVHDATTHHPVVVTGRLGEGTFAPSGIERFDLGPDLYAPCLLEDDGRAVVWGWTWEATTPEVQEAAGWAGALSLPRVLEHRDGRVEVRPLPELERLRRRCLTTSLGGGSTPWRLEGVRSDTFELEMSLPGGAGPVELSVLCSPDGSEQTVIRVADGALWLDRDHASLDRRATGGVYGGQLPVAPRPTDRLRVFVDRSVVEVFYAGVALTARVYPTRPDALGVRLATTQPPADVTVWELGTIWSSPALRT